MAKKIETHPIPRGYIPENIKVFIKGTFPSKACSKEADWESAERLLERIKREKKEK